VSHVAPGASTTTTPLVSPRATSSASAGVVATPRRNGDVVLAQQPLRLTLVNVHLFLLRTASPDPSPAHSFPLRTAPLRGPILR
jgi:hypothetical protein